LNHGDTEKSGKGTGGLPAGRQGMVDRITGSTGSGTGMEARD